MDLQVGAESESARRRRLRGKLLEGLPVTPIGLPERLSEIPVTLRCTQRGNARAVAVGADGECGSRRRPPRVRSHPSRSPGPGCSPVESDVSPLRAPWPEFGPCGHHVLTQCYPGQAARVPVRERPDADSNRTIRESDTGEAASNQAGPGARGAAMAGRRLRPPRSQAPCPGLPRAPS